MNSKEALERLEDNGKEYLLPVRVYKLIKQDLERLEQLEIANKNNEGLVRENVDLINRNLKLQDENANLKQDIASLELDTCIPQLRKENTKLKQAIRILKENLYIEFEHNYYFMVKFKEDKEQECDYTIMFLDNKEEYELLKEVLDCEY